jgi:hypothetical protein
MGNADFKFHPLADIFPLMEGQEFDELVADIGKNGLQENIVIYEDKILDGRNRYRACKGAGVSYFSSAYVGDDPLGFIISRNLHRRHLTEEKRRELITDIIKAKPEASDRSIAKQVKRDHKTVGTIRKKLESTGEVSPVEKRVGSDGKGRKQPSTKRKKSVAGEPLFMLGGAVTTFSTRAMELVRLTRNKSAERFAKTALSDDNIRHLAKFFVDLARIRQGSGSTQQSAEVSTEQRKVEHAALDEIPDDLSIPAFMQRRPAS